MSLQSPPPQGYPLQPASSIDQNAKIDHLQSQVNHLTSLFESGSSISPTSLASIRNISGYQHLNTNLLSQVNSHIDARFAAYEASPPTTLRTAAQQAFTAVFHDNVMATLPNAIKTHVTDALSSPTFF